jgi:hypothetical protein
MLPRLARPAPGQRGRSRLGAHENGRAGSLGRSQHGTKDSKLAGRERRACRLVSGRYWHHLRQEQPASEAADPKFQDLLIASLNELTGVGFRRLDRYPVRDGQVPQSLASLGCFRNSESDCCRGGSHELLRARVVALKGTFLALNGR